MFSFVKRIFKARTQTPVAIKVRSGSELPNQLVIRKGRVVHRVTGEAPCFDYLPDGLEVNIVPHNCLKRILASAALYHESLKTFRGSPSTQN